MTFYDLHLDDVKTASLLVVQAKRLELLCCSCQRILCRGQGRDRWWDGLIREKRLSAVTEACC